MENEEIGVRIAAEREKRNMSQSDLARAIGISPQAVQKWEAGGQPRFNRMKDVAAALQLELRDLVRGTVYEAALQFETDLPDNTVAKDRLREKRREITERKLASYEGKLPLISWVQAGAWSEIVNNFHPGDAEDWISVPFNHGPGAFCLRVVGESMFDPTGPKSYAPGDFIAVDPTRDPQNRSMVVVRVDHEDKATFKQLLVDGETMMLKALNPNWPNKLIEIPPGSKIVGVVIGKWVPE